MKATATQAGTYRHRAKRPADAPYRLGGMTWAEFKRAAEKAHAEFFKRRNIDTDTLPAEISVGFTIGKR